MKITKRQFIMLIITLACLILLSWEVYQLITDDSASLSTVPTKNTLTRKFLRHDNAKVSIKTVTAQNSATSQVQLQPYIKNNRPVLIKNQKKYIELVKKIELAKMQRRLIDEEAAIAAAKNRIAILNTQTSKIIAGNTNHNTHPAAVSDQCSSQAVYQLVFLVHQGNNWRATLHTNESTARATKDKRHTTPKPVKHRRAQTLKKKTTAHPSAKSATPSTLSASEAYTYTLDEILLLELPANNYTIFLKGSFNKHDLDMLAKKERLGPKAIYYSILKKGQPWFILLYNHYNTKAEAQNALQQLSDKLQRFNPHIEGIAVIQVAIKAQFGIHALLR